MKKKLFGTDGVRGKVGVAPITAECMLKLGWAIGSALARPESTILIGKDTRISGYMLESVLEAGLSSAGVNVSLLGPMPTPGIAYLTQTLSASAGIVISASHNPYYDNGIKLFNRQGKKLADELEQAIENYAEKEIVTVDSEKLGKAKRVEDAAGRYVEFCKSSIPLSISLNGLKIVLDCANGATYHIAPYVFTEKGAKVSVIGNQPNGLNINLECGSQSTDHLRAQVLATQADLGIAFDGDGDRVIMVDNQGNIVDGDDLLYVIAMSRHQNKQPLGPVVGTLMSNFGLEVALNQYNIQFIRAQVGDRYVMEALHKSGGLLGGESSGHLICLDKTSTGDGIIAALQVLESMITTGKSLADLTAGIEKYPQEMINVKLTEKIDINNNEKIQQAQKAVTDELGQQGRVLLRASGTEPLIRVMVEGHDHQLVKKMAQQLADEVKRVIK